MTQKSESKIGSAIQKPTMFDIILLYLTAKKYHDKKNILVITFVYHPLHPKGPCG